VTTVTNLTGIYERVAKQTSTADLRRVLWALRGEPEPHHPHIQQALSAFTREAAERGLEIDNDQRNHHHH
jgi:hypothetical protein